MNTQQKPLIGKSFFFCWNNYATIKALLQMKLQFPNCKSETISDFHFTAGKMDFSINAKAGKRSSSLRTK